MGIGIGNPVRKFQVVGGDVSFSPTPNSAWFIAPHSVTGGPSLVLTA